VRITNGVANTYPGDFGRELERGCKGGVEERKKREKRKKMETAEQRRLDAEQRKAEAIAP
jgi:hypothetical protein